MKQQTRKYVYHGKVVMPVFCEIECDTEEQARHYSRTTHAWKLSSGESVTLNPDDVYVERGLVLTTDIDLDTKAETQ